MKNIFGHFPDHSENDIWRLVQMSSANGIVCAVHLHKSGQLHSDLTDGNFMLIFSGPRQSCSLCNI